MKMDGTSIFLLMLTFDTNLHLSFSKYCSYTHCLIGLFEYYGAYKRKHGLENFFSKCAVQYRRILMIPIRVGGFARGLSTSLQLPPCDFQPQRYKGLSADKQRKVRAERINPAIGNYYSTPLALSQGHKQWLFDVDGKRYLDMFGGICTVSVGHCHPKITKAVKEQMETLGHVSNIYYHSKLHEYAERLTMKFPGDLKVVYFVNSGSEANDLAVLMARCYTQRQDIITLRNGYHGMTCQTMALTATGTYKYPVPQAPSVHSTMNPDVYKGLWGGNHCRDSLVQTSRPCTCPSHDCSAKDNYFEQFLEVLEYNVPQRRPAAFFAESIQGVGGVVQYPRGFLREVREAVRRGEGLYVADEVQTGFGRTGEHFWGFEMHEIVPDIVTMAKGIGNGFPLGAVVTTKEVAAALAKAAHFNTYGGNPLACAAGIAVLDIIEEEKLQENCRVVGSYLLKELEKLRTKYSTVGDVRGKGLMIGVELVTGDGTTKPLDAERFMVFWEHTREAGLIIGRGGINGNVLRIKPPMCVTKEDAAFTVGVIEDALKKI